MLIAEFSHKGEEIEIENELWQYDYGQRLQIKGLDLPETFEVHYAWKDSEKAKVVIGSTVNGISTVDIPNVALEQRRTITAYIYLSDTTEGETVNTIVLSVNKRKAPENFETPEDVDLFHHTLAATAEYQRQAKESEKQAAARSADAEAWAHGREDHPEQARDNAKYYAEQAAKMVSKIDNAEAAIKQAGQKQIQAIADSLDNTLTAEGKAADAKAVGEKFAKVNKITDSLKEDLVTNVGGLSEKTYVVKMSYEKGYISGNNGILGINNINYRTANIINLSRGDILTVNISKVRAVPHTYEDGIWKKYYTSFSAFCADGYGALTATSTTWTINIIKNCDIRIVVSLLDNSEIGSISQFADTVIITKLYNYKRIDNLEKSVSELTTDTILLKENKCDYPSILKKQNINILDGVIRGDGVLVNSQDSTNKHIEISIDSHYDKGSVCVSGSCLWKSNIPFLLFLNSSEVLETYGYDTGKFYENYVIDSVPVGCTKIAVNCQTKVGYLQYLLKTNLPIEEYINNKLEDPKTKNDSYWTGKKIVWFGTSIPAGVVNAGESGGNGSYPVRIGEMLGATVYNESVGSSAVRGGNHNSISSTDPMGYSGLYATCLMLSLSLSSDEKKAIFDEWDTKWENILHYASDVDTTNKQKYYDTSWDIKLAKYLSGGSVGQCDLYVFDHGHNDAVVGWDYDELKTIPPIGHESNRTYFIGAMRFVIEKILADNPKARICFIGHYENDRKTGISEAQEILANIWKYPLFKTWEHIGWSQNKVTVNGIEKTITQIWMPDDLHPSSDTSGEALKHYANVLYPFMRDVR